MAGAKETSKLSLFDSSGMAIGAMVGGGIFAVLGEATQKAGNAAFISFGLAGILALITGLSYARLTLSYDESGGSFTYLEHMAGKRIAGTVIWFLMLGQIFTISLYAVTFGAYAGQLLGIGPGYKMYFGSGLVVALTLINLAGVRQSALTEDILVYTKVAILLLTAAVGFFLFSPHKAFPVVSHGSFNVISGAALIFVAYEGFELLSYDYDDLKDKHRNLPRTTWISIIFVIFLYMLVALVTTGSLAQSVISAHSETVLAYVAQPVLGRAGFVLVLVAALFSTTSAINATMFAVGRLADRVSDDGQFPHELTDRTLNGVPLVFMIVMALVSIALQFTGNIGQITSFASLTFLAVYSIVNMAALYHRSFKGFLAIFPAFCTFGCLVSVVVLIYNLYKNSAHQLYIIAGIALVMIVLRIAFVYWHPHFLANLDKRLET